MLFLRITGVDAKGHICPLTVIAGLPRNPLSVKDSLSRRGWRMFLRHDGQGSKDVIPGEVSIVQKNNKHYNTNTMKTRLFFAALLLLAFGTMRAQVNEPKPIDPKTDSIMKSRMAEIKQAQEQFSDRMRELGMNLQYLSDSIDWKTFEQDMEQWGAEMEEWGRKMEQWGAEFERKFDMPNNYHPEKKDNSPIRVIRVTGSGDVVISQTPGHFSLKKEGEIVSDYRAESDMLLLSSSHDYEVEVSQLENIQLLSSADVICKNTIKGDYINVYNSGSGDMVMKLDYDTVHVVLNGSGDIILQGRCNVLEAMLLGSGDLNVDGLNVVKSNAMEKSSSKEYKSKDRRPVKKNLLFDANWNGFEAAFAQLVFWFQHRRCGRRLRQKT